MQEKPMYTLQELFENLPISLRKLSQLAKVNEVTAARIRDGNPGLRSTINRLLAAMSGADVYNRPLSLSNVTGVLIQGENRVKNEDDEGDSDQPLKPAA